MTQPQVRPYGSWLSPISASEVFAKAVFFGCLRLDGGDLYWVEALPEGRSVIVRRQPGGQITRLTPDGFDVRTRVHEYGGADFLVANGVVYFSQFADQRLYRQPLGGAPEPFTTGEGLRYADAVLDEQRGRLIAVREDHTTGGQQAVNTLVALPLSGGSPGEVLVSGNDFYAGPRLSPDGRWLAWLTWNHPNMPWDGTELWVAELAPDGALGPPTLVAGGPAESIFQPAWSPDGSLYWVSDQSGWWNLYRQRARSGAIEALCPMEAEFGQPQWLLGPATYAFVSAELVFCYYAQNGFDHLASLDTRTLQLTPVALPYTGLFEIAAAPDQVFFTGGSGTHPWSLVRLELASGQMEVVRAMREMSIDREDISEAQPIEFPTGGGLSAHAFYYPPRNRRYRAPAGGRPPLLVIAHGGPTGATMAVMRYSVQYWTTRGFAVLDVNYGGSTGFGRAYRQRLAGQWGLVDVADCVNGARYLAEQGLVDGDRLAIAGGSAGGFLALCALTFYDTFKAGASYFGISDLEAMAKDTHKFEARYLDGLVGPYPDQRDVYVARSPLYHLHRLARPLILFQGLDDPIVPPNQSQMMFEAVRARELPVAYVAFPGEQHGFVKAENNIRSLEAELYFYSRIFKFELAEPVEPVMIENLEG
jgi:dipeptidyl aminopeptidase/acylaminoacyl peptidase